MDDSQAKADLLRYLQDARDALLWKLDGLSEYDMRRPMTPTGTNLLGLVKHLTGVELGYFGDTFGRPFFGDDAPEWYRETAEDNADMWATAEESREHIVGLYRQAWEHTAATVAELPLDATGSVPWWPADRQSPTLHHLLVRVLADTQRHAGHADILRELSDGAVGYTAERDNMPPGDQAAWEEHWRRVEAAAREAGKS
ncbi:MULTISPECIES: DinB family protein [Streptomyces]|uniref:DinB family protein n=1 Tax=Streptomyces solicathayae TaxID=3081768 RepID=A0ABZ0LUB5_9ACTN|nr:DinB family protein [Streptomyces sp. HUAS YS2]WOX22348.1 DinB family protein [Streptomyces sp. HUAS YS2]